MLPALWLSGALLAVPAFGTPAAQRINEAPIWAELDKVQAEYDQFKEKLAPKLEELRRLQESYHDPDDPLALVRQRNALSQEISDLFGELESRRERFDSLVKSAQVSALASVIVRRGASAEEAGAASAKLLAYDERKAEMGRVSGEFYELMHNDQQAATAIGVVIARRWQTKVIVSSISAAVVVVALMALFFRWRAPAAPAGLVPSGLPAQTPVGLAAPTAAPALPLDAGLIGGNFRIVRELGRGGMGIVYEAFDETLHRPVALKRLREELSANDRDAEQFLAEARMVASLKHPNLVEIYSIVREGAALFLVFEFVRGWTLQQLLQAKGRLNLAQARFVAHKMGAALDYAHARKVVHRDLKPSNVMITEDRQVKVMDFGIAYQAKATVARMTRAEAWGTPPYMAPEQELGSVGPEVDLYALGVCLYEMATGQLPFTGPNFLAQKTERVYTPPTQLDAALPMALDGIVRKALAPEPAERFRSGAELDKALAGL